MKPVIKTIAVLIASALIASVFAACGKEDNGGATNRNWKYEAGATDGTTAADIADVTVPDNGYQGFDIKVNNAWKANYVVEYTYFSSMDEETVDQRIREVRYDNVFLAKEAGTGEFEYFVQNGTDIDCYTVSPVKDIYVHTQKKNESISTIETFFMKRSALGDDISKKQNVIRMDEEDYIAGRRCYEYVMRAYRDGVVSETVFFWVDANYGNALKCLCYNEKSELVLSWEVTLFNVGTAKNTDVDVDLAQYHFTEGADR